MKYSLIFVLGLVAMASSGKVNVIETNPDQVNVVENNPDQGVNVVENNPDQVHVVDNNPLEGLIVNSNPDPAFFQPSNPNAGQGPNVINPVDSAFLQPSNPAYLPGGLYYPPPAYYDRGPNVMNPVDPFFAQPSNPGFLQGQGQQGHYLVPNVGPTFVQPRFPPYPYYPQPYGLGLDINGPNVPIEQRVYLQKHPFPGARDGSKKSQPRPVVQADTTTTESTTQ